MFIAVQTLHVLRVRHLCLARPESSPVWTATIGGGRPVGRAWPWRPSVGTAPWSSWSTVDAGSSLWSSVLACPRARRDRARGDWAGAGRYARARSLTGGEGGAFAERSAGRLVGACPASASTATRSATHTQYIMRSMVDGYGRATSCPGSQGTVSKGYTWLPHRGPGGTAGLPRARTCALQNTHRDKD
jgi:hypothetical protein